jgi:hypothetical protein
MVGEGRGGRGSTRDYDLDLVAGGKRRGGRDVRKGDEEGCRGCHVQRVAGMATKCRQTGPKALGGG